MLRYISLPFSKRVRTIIAITSFVSLLGLVGFLAGRTKESQQGSSDGSTSKVGQESQIKESYGTLPLSFEANRGQVDSSVKYVARGSGYSLFLTQNEAVLALSAAARTTGIDDQEEVTRKSVRKSPPSEAAAAESSVLRMKVLGGNPNASVAGEKELPGKSNYFIGKDPKKWHRGISSFAKVNYRGIYPGIDLTYYGNQRQLEYDFVIQPRVDPKQIALSFEGADQVSVDDAGDLVLRVAGREVRQQKPFAYQEVNGAKREVVSRYRLISKNEIGFELGEYDTTKPLVIDPVLVYSTYFGGVGGENATSIAVNSAGEAFITGTAPSVGFPGTPLQGSSAAGGDAYVVKLNAAGTAIVYASYFGGDNSDNPNAIAVDQNGNAYVAGATQSFNFPLAGTPYQATKRGGSQMSRTVDGGSTYTTPALTGLTTASISGVAVHPTDPNTVIVSSFGGQGIYKTTNGGATWASIRGTIPDTFNNAVAIDPTNPSNIYLATCQPGGIYRSSDGGNTWSATSVSGLCMNTVITDQTGVIYAGGFDGQGLHKSTDGGQTWNTYAVGVNFDSVASLAIDPLNLNVLYAGTSAGVYKSLDGGQTWNVTGLSTGEAFDDSIAIDPNNSQIVYTVNSSQLKITTDGGATWSDVTNLGISAGGFPTALMIAPTNPSTVYVGSTTNGVLKSTNNGASWAANASTDDVSSMAFAPSNLTSVYVGLLSGSDAFVTKLNPSGSSLVYSTYLGGGAASNRGDKDDGALAIAVDASGNAFVGGFTDTTDFPTVDGLQPFGGQIDAFLAKLDSGGSNLSFSTTFGGILFDTLRGVALGTGGSVFIAGRTDGGIPTVNAAQSTHGGGQDAYVMRLVPSGGSYSIAYSTYLGGAGQDLSNGVAVDANNNAYIVGQTNTGGLGTAGAAQVTKGTAVDAFLAKFDQNGVKNYFTYIGGGGPAAGQASLDAASSVAVDAAGNAYVAGYTRSSGFPVNNSLKAFNATMCGALPCYDAFVTKLNATGSARVFSTLLGGDADDQAAGIAVDQNGGIYVTGLTSSIEFKPGALQATNGGLSDAFITKLGSSNDLSVSLSDNPDPASVNGLLTYTVTVTNSGEGNLTSVTVSDNLPANTTFVSATSSQGSCSGTSSINCNIGSLNVGQNATITIRVTATSAGTLSNTASATGAESETNTSNNSATQTTNVTAGTIYTVNSTADANDAACTAVGTGNGCTLREAIAAANTSSGPDKVSFNIPTSDPGFNGSVFTIRPLSTLPTLTDSGTTIDGATQTLFSGNTNAAGPEVVINGGLMGFSAPYGGGLNVPSSGNHIHSLVINGFNNTGISITGAGATGNLVTGCFLGTNAAGTGGVPNTFDGMVITQGAGNNVVGGISLADRNLISGNMRNGMTIQVNTNFNMVLGNFIGTEVTGTLPLSNASVGIQIGGTASSNLIGGTNVGARNVISGNSVGGIAIIEADATANQVQGNFIGTNVAGNAVIPNGGVGVQLRSSLNNTVGGTANGAGNLITGNRGNGVEMINNASGNVVVGNYIGTDVTGMSALVTTFNGLPAYGNGSGVAINGSSNNRVGGITAAERNVISGNNCQGVPIYNQLVNNVVVQSSNNTIQGNYIGLNKNGTALVTDPNAGPAFGNKCSGIFIGGATNNLIGGTAAGAGNVIGGSAHQGVVISNNNSVIGSANTIQGNIIGSNVAMTTPLPNGIGIFLINGASNNTIGGDDDDDGTLDGVVNAGNKIFGSSGDGINIQSAFINGANAIATGNTVQGNLIGGSTLLRNGNNGVNLNGAVNTVIGGMSAGAGNTIAFNANNGIVLNCAVLNGVPICAVGAQILSNSIYSHNNNLGIRFNSNGANFGNNNQAAPSLFFVGANGSNTNFGGKLTSTANSNFRIQVFSNDSCNPTGSGEGQRLVGTTTTASDGSGVANFALTGSAQVGEFITATATDTNTNNTSRFSPCVQAVAYQAGTLQYSLASFGVSEGVGNALITVSRSGDNTGAATVNYATADGTALAGSDYTTTSGTLSFAAGDSFKSFLVPILNDSTVESVKALNLTLNSPSSGSVLGAQTTATLSIVDNDPAPSAGNNGKIAFGRRINNTGGGEIFVMDQNGSNAVNVTNNAADDQQPAWSPDGTKIAFMSNRSGTYQVHTMNADGSNVIQLTTGPLNHYTPTWSPDGTMLVFESDDTDLYVMNADGTNTVRLTNTPGLEANTDWSPDGTKILYTSAPGAVSTYELYVINADGTNPVQLTNNTAYDDWGQWSPDGSKIVFQTNRGALASEVYVMNADGSNQINLSNTEATEAAPSWSSDGTRITFGTNRDGNSEIYSMNADGSGVTRLTTTPPDAESYPRWQPVEQKQNQTITFNALANKTYGNASFNVSATASSNLPVTFSVVSGPATVSGNTVTITGAGLVTVRATQAGDATYNSATADQSFTVAPVLLRVVADSKTKVFGSPNPTFTVHYSGFVNSEGPNVLGGALSFSTAADNNPVGSYSITPSGYSSSNYTLQYLAATLTIDQASTSTASGNYNLPVPGNVNLVAQVTGDSPSTATVTGGTVTFVIHQGATTVGTVTSAAVSSGQASANFNVPAGGAYTVYASYSGNSNYLGSTGIASLTVGNANPVPSISGVTPDSAVKKPTETGQFTLLIDGNGFMSTSNGDPASSTVDWYDRTTGQHTNLAITSTTAMQIQAVVPFTLIRDGKTVEVSVINPGPGGGTSNVQPFFVTDTTATVTSAETVLPDPVTGTASTTTVTPTGAVLSAEASSGGAGGSGTLTIAQYSADPIGTNASPNTSAFSTSDGGGYFDVYVAPGSSFTNLSLDYCNTGGTTLYWWDGSVWALVSNQTYNPGTGCITVTVTTTTSPSIAQLTGTVFGVASGPAISSISVTPSATVAVGSGPITLNAGITDAGGTGPYTAEINWGDGQTTTLNTVTGPTLTAAHSYSAANTYAIAVKISRGSSFGTSTYSPVVVFDPNGGSMKGNGWFNAPLGSYPSNPSFAGKVHFESDAKYEKNTNQLTGSMNVSLPGKDFKSNSVSWLTINGSKVQIKGLGSINNAGSFSFLLTGIDGKLDGKKLPDKVRIKIWNQATGQIIYDGQMDAADSAPPTLVLGGGNINIKK